MFSNRFNTKNDPLLEAVKGAMQDGDLRRQAVALVNEAFGVYNRNAVVREQLAAYDAAIEEAYRCVKEGKPNDGNLANNYPPYDKVTRGDVIAGATGKDQMGGKKKKMEEEEQIDEISKKLAVKTYLGRSKQNADDWHGLGGDDSLERKVQGSHKRIEKKFGKKTAERARNIATSYYEEETQIDEISHKLALKAMKKSDERGEEEYDRDMTDDRLSDPKTHWDRAKRLRGHMKRKFGNKTIKTGGTDNLSPKSYEQGGGERRRADKLKKGPRAGMISARHRDKLKHNIKYSLGKHKKPNLPEEVDYSAPDRAAVTRDNKPSTPAQTNAATSGPSAADRAALASKISTMKEALKGRQHEIDANKNKRIDAGDFKLLRARKSMKEASDVPGDDKSWRGVEKPHDYTADEARSIRKEYEGSKGEIRKDNKYPGL